MSDIARSAAAPSPSAAMREAIVRKAHESADTSVRFFEENAEALEGCARALAGRLESGGRLWVMGNGGSACDAQHIAVEFMHPITVGRRALPAICLSNDMAMMTAVANDVGFQDVFVRQLLALAKAGDVLLGVSTSGNSENLLHAFSLGQRMGLVTIGFSGNDGGRMEEMRADGLLDFCLSVPTASIHRIQETHVTLYHIIWDLVHTLLEHPALLAEPVEFSESAQQPAATALEKGN